MPPTKSCRLTRGIGALLALGLPAGASADPFSLLLDTAERDALRQAVADPGWKRDLYQAPLDAATPRGVGVRSNADRWLARTIAVPGRGGWYHDWFCEDGTRLEIPPDQRFGDPPYRCPACGRAYDDARREAARRHFEHNWLAAAAVDCALVAVLEDSEPHAAKAKEILLKIAATYPGRHTDPTEGGLLRQTLDEAVWVIPLAYAYDLLSASGRLTPADSRAVGGFLRECAAGLRAAGTHLNWGSWHLAACGVAGFAVGDADLAQWAIDAFKDQITSQLGDDGLWPESVHAYHFYPLAAFLHLAESARHRGIDLYAWEARPGKNLKAMFTQPLRCMYTDFRIPAINDGWFQSFLPLDLYELAVARYGDDELRWALREGYRRADAGGGAAGLRPRGGLWSFLYGGDLDAVPTPPAFASADFGSLGVAVLRSGNDAMLTFDYGPLLQHGHLDRLGITLWAHGRLRAADYGTPGYGILLAGWYRKTEAHNTVVVDGTDQEPSADVARTALLGDPFLELVEASTTQAYPGVTHTRTVVRAGETFVVWDRLDSEGAERTFDWFLRGEGNLVPGFPTTPGLMDPALPYRHGPRLLLGTRTAPWAARWEDDAGGLLLWMDASPESPVDVGWGTAPAESAAREVELVAARRRGRSAQFLAVLAPYRGADAPRVRMEAGVIIVEAGGAEDYIAMRGVAAGKGAALAADGRAAAARVRGGKVEATAALEGGAPVFRGRRARE